MKEKEVRINKYLSELGFCSRREADKLIQQGRVSKNRKLSVLGEKITSQDMLHVDGELISKPKNYKKIYIAFNKPVGIVCTTDRTREKNNIIDFINFPKRIFPVGRLDKASEGLIFLTNDGEIVNKILRSRNNHEKEYHVVVNKPITEEFTKQMSNGVPILGRKTKKCIIKQTGKKTFKIILTQGLNRQIRRMTASVGFPALRLIRTQINQWKLDNIKVGSYVSF